jgi:small-conductance mechanosensitive channel
MQAFFIQLWQEIQRSLGETFRLFEGEDANWSTVLASFASKLLVSALLVGIFIVAFLLLRAGLNLLMRRLKLSGDLISPIILALRYTVVVLAVLALMVQYGVPSSLSSAVARAAVMIFAFFAGWIVLNRFLKTYLSKRRLDPSLIQLFDNVTSVVIGIFAATTVLSQFGINVFSIITTLGVVGIAVGFAAQDTLANFIAGITLLVERPFRIGEWISVGGQIGKVNEINLRTTRLQTRDSEIIVMPNARVASSDIVNLSAGGPLRIRVPIGIAYKETVVAARKVLLPLLEQHSDILKKPEPSVRLVELADSSLNLEMVYWVAPKTIDTEPKIRTELLEQAKYALDEANIEIPFPHLQLFVDGVKALEPYLKLESKSLSVDLENKQ